MNLSVPFSPSSSSSLGPASLVLSKRNISHFQPHLLATRHHYPSNQLNRLLFTCDRSRVWRTNRCNFRWISSLFFFERYIENVIKCICSFELLLCTVLTTNKRVIDTAEPGTEMSSLSWLMHIYRCEKLVKYGWLAGCVRMRLSRYSVESVAHAYIAR